MSEKGFLHIYNTFDRHQSVSDRYPYAVETTDCLGIIVKIMTNKTDSLKWSAPSGEIQTILLFLVDTVQVPNPRQLNGAHNPEQDSAC
jgi:hypothetical protein